MVSEFGRKVDFIQAEMDVSLNDLAKRLRKSRQCVYRIKKSVRPRARTVHSFARALNVPVSVFFGIEMEE